MSHFICLRCFRSIGEDLKAGISHDRSAIGTHGSMDRRPAIFPLGPKRRVDGTDTLIARNTIHQPQLA